MNFFTHQCCYVYNIDKKADNFSFALPNFGMHLLSWSHVSRSMLRSMPQYKAHWSMSMINNIPVNHTSSPQHCTFATALWGGLSCKSHQFSSRLHFCNRPEGGASAGNKLDLQVSLHNKP